MDRRSFLRASALLAAASAGCTSSGGAGADTPTRSPTPGNRKWGLPPCEAADRPVRVLESSMRVEERPDADRFVVVVNGEIRNTGDATLGVEAFGDLIRDGKKLAPGLASIDDEGENVHYVLEPGETTAFRLIGAPREEPERYTILLRAMPPDRAENAEILDWMRAERVGCH